MLRAKHNFGPLIVYSLDESAKVWLNNEIQKFNERIMKKKFLWIGHISSCCEKFFLSFLLYEMWKLDVPNSADNFNSRKDSSLLLNVVGL